MTYIKLIHYTAVQLFRYTSLRINLTTVNYCCMSILAVLSKFDACSSLCFPIISLLCILMHG